MHNNVYEIKSSEGRTVKDPGEIKKAFLDYYEDMLGTEMPSRIHVNSSIVQKGTVLTSDQRRDMITPITKTDIKQAIWEINGDQAPSPNGYSSQFFKGNWAVVR